MGLKKQSTGERGGERERERYNSIPNQSERGKERETNELERWNGGERVREGRGE